MRHCMYIYIYMTVINISLILRSGQWSGEIEAWTSI